jgi:putative ABC transport system ATP-binding protein
MIQNNSQLQHAEQLIEVGQRDQAVATLKTLIQTDRANVQAWWLLCGALDNEEQRRTALNRVIALDPSHEGARQMLSRLEGPAVLRVQTVTKTIRSGELAVTAINAVSFNIYQGEMVGIVGPSGSGKSTLLGLLGGLDTPTDGQIWLDEVEISSLDERALTRLRNEKIGFVFQAFNLLPMQTALENVALPVRFAVRREFKPLERATELLTLLGMGDRLQHRPAQLSGGQQQRVAIARALANNPTLLLCDEPTGNLDSSAAESVMTILRDVQQRLKTTVLIVTHDTRIAASLDRVITLRDGAIASDTGRTPAHAR